MLQITNLSVTYGGVKAVTDVSFDVAAGQLVGLIGPNGAGKTSLIDAVTGFTPYAGSVTLDGAPVDGVSPQHRSRLGLNRTWQTADLFDELSVGDNLAIAGHHRGWRQLITDLVVPGRRAGGDAAQRALSLLGLEDLRDRLPDELSQGQRKLVDVARAVAGSARLLCLDEPAAGLDSAESATLGRRLRDIVGTGTSILLVDHDMGLVLSTCDHIVVLDFGRVIASGSPEEVRSDPRVIDAYIGTEHAAPGPEATSVASNGSVPPAPPQKDPQWQ